MATKGGFKTKRDALEYLGTLRCRDLRTVPTLLDLYDVWERADMPKLSDNKQTAYRIARRRLESIIDRKIDTLTTSDLQKVIDGLSHYPARDIKTLLSHLYKRAIADQFVPTNLALYMSLPEVNEKEATPFTAEEVKRMWTAYADGDTFAGYMLLMIYSGMMPGELLACKKSMIDFDRCEIHGVGKKTKTRKETPLAFSESIVPVLRTLCALNADERLYAGRDRFYAEYHEATRRIGVRDLPPYSCRHTTGTEAAKLGLNAPTIQQIMRHAKITTTQRYIHLTSTEAHDGLNSMTNA